jgi:hypothetical protein
MTPHQPSRLQENFLNNLLRSSEKLRTVEATIKAASMTLEGQFNSPNLKQQYANALRDAVVESGQTMDAAQITLATENYFSQLHTLKEPRRNANTRFAEAYVERERIGRKYGVPTLVTIVAAAAIWAGSLGIKSAHKTALENRVEKRVENVFRQTNVTREELDVAQENPVYGQLPESEKVRMQTAIESADKKLTEVSGFLEEFCPNGSAEDAVTRENFQQVGVRVGEHEKTLRVAQEKSSEASGILKNQEQLVTTRKSLGSSLAEIENMNSVETFNKRANEIYNNGIICVDNRQLAEARKHDTNLSGIKKTVGLFEELRRTITPLYGEVNGIAKEEESKREAEQIYSDAGLAIESANFPKLQSVSKNLSELGDLLNQEFTEYVVDCDRRMPDDSRIRTVRFYLVTERKDKNGQNIPITILHEENKSTIQVNRRGYRVGEVQLNWGETPEDVRKSGREPDIYTRVRMDIEDNGVIDDAKFAVKERGYKNPKVVMKGVPAYIGEYPY